MVERPSCHTNDICTCGQIREADRATAESVDRSSALQMLDCLAISLEGLATPTLVNLGFAEVGEVAGEVDGVWCGRMQ